MPLQGGFFLGTVFPWRCHGLEEKCPLRGVLANFPGLRLVDEPGTNTYPLPLDVAGQDDCQVGRLRKDCALENGLSFWVVGDQLLKGAALNAVQIAERI